MQQHFSLSRYHSSLMLFWADLTSDESLRQLVKKLSVSSLLSLPPSFLSARHFFPFFVVVHSLGPAARSTSRPSCILTGKRAVNASRKLRAENTLVEENNGARRKEIANTAARRKITLMYLYNGAKSSFIMTRDSLGYPATTLALI